MRRVVVITEPAVFEASDAARLLGDAMGVELVNPGRLWRDEVDRGTVVGQRIWAHLQAGEPIHVSRCCVDTLWTFC
jgi:hypothetical protein